MLTRGKIIAVFYMALMSCVEAQILEAKTVLVADTTSESAFVSVEAEHQSNGFQLPSAITGGWFTGGLQLAGLSQKTNASGRDAVVARMQQTSHYQGEGTWNYTWCAHISSTNGNSEIVDVALANDGTVWVAGTYTGDIAFEGSSHVLSYAVGTAGFIAQIDESSGNWVSVIALDDMVPVSLAVDEDENLYVTGAGALARKLNSSGQVLWNQVVSGGSSESCHIKVSDATGRCFISGSKSGTKVSQYGRNSVILSHGRENGTPNEESGVQLQFTQEVDFDLAVRRFNGGMIYLTVDSGGTVQVLNAGQNWSVAEITHGVEVFGGDNAGELEELRIRLSDVQSVQITVMYSESSRGSAGLCDYEFLFDTLVYEDSQDVEQLAMFSHPNWSGEVAGAAFQMSAADFSGAGVGMQMVSHEKFWKEKHQASFSRAPLTQQMGGNRDVFVASLERDTGDVVGVNTGGSNEMDHPGGLALDHSGRVWTTFSTEAANIDFGSHSLSAAGPVGERLYMVGISGNGEVKMSSQLNLVQAAGAKIQSHDISLGPNGSVFISGSINGSHSILNRSHLATNDAFLIGASVKGEVFSFYKTDGASVVDGLGVSVALNSRLMLVGCATDDGSFKIDDVVVASVDSQPVSTTESTTETSSISYALPQKQLFFGCYGQADDQKRYVIQSKDGTALTQEQVKVLVNESGGQVYLSLNDRDDVESSVAGHILDTDVATLQSHPDLVVQEDYKVVLNSAGTDWARAHVQNHTASSPYTYTSPETSETVYFYPIDTAIANPNGYFDGNPNLTLHDSTLIYGAGDPTVSSEFDHGTKLMSLVAGPGVGIAENTPMIVKGYDVYPNGSTTYVSYIAEAVLSAVEEHETQADGAPGVILIASSTVFSGGSVILEDAVDSAIEAGMVVVVSAGNHDGDASNYVPAGYGTTDGVICVGAIEENNDLWTNYFYGTNTGAAVDIYAPGKNVRVIDPDDGTSYLDMDGTSPASALAAGAVILTQSVNPYGTVAQWESTVTGDGAVVPWTTGSGSSLQVQVSADGPSFSSTYNDWSTAQGLGPGTQGNGELDDDGDGWSNKWEYFRKQKALVADQLSPPLTMSKSVGEVDFTFEVATYLFDKKNLGELKDGTRYEIVKSTDLGQNDPWTPISGVITYTPQPGGRTLISFDATESESKAFYRLRFVDP